MLVSDYKRRWCEIRLDTIVKLLIARSIFHDHYVGYKSNLQFQVYRNDFVHANDLEKIIHPN